jgi:predicted ester cyclase
MALGTLDDFRELVHAEAVNREAGIEPPECRGRGPAAWYATALWLRNMAPDIGWEIHEVIADGDLIAVHCTMTGHQTGDHTHYDTAGNVQRVIPASNRPFATTQTHWMRFKDGKLIEHWANRDDLTMNLQLGWLAPGGASARHAAAEDNRFPDTRRAGLAPSVPGTATDTSALERVLSFVRSINLGDIDAAVAHFDIDVHNHGRKVGHAGMRAVFEAHRLVFPDWHHEIAQTVTEGTTVATRSFLSGTHRGTVGEPMLSLLFNGALRGIEPEGRSMQIQATHIFEVGDDGLIVAHWANRDDLGMRSQLSEDR